MKVPFQIIGVDAAGQPGAPLPSGATIAVTSADATIATYALDDAPALGTPAYRILGRDSAPDDSPPPFARAPSRHQSAAPARSRLFEEGPQGRQVRQGRDHMDKAKLRTEVRCQVCGRLQSIIGVHAEINRRTITWAVASSFSPPHNRVVNSRFWFFKSRLVHPSAHLRYTPILLITQKSEADKIMEAGRVSTHAMARFRTVLHCSPVWLAAMVPATPDESTWVVLTGSPNQSAAPMVNIAVISAAAPCP